ncbi:MAG: hypothetical protein M1837_004468 [Sclerophora amabilis]|nr:MAG: hypothetical protein M1837_004468 [Sclerophora amabilis]
MVGNPASSQTFTSPPPSQIHLYGSQSMSPVTSTSATPQLIMPNATQPASPKGPQHSADRLTMPNPSRQLHPPKIPLYVPAVLRPTERPTRQSSLTPPQSSSNSVESLKGLSSPNALSRRWTGENPSRLGQGRFIEDEWLENLGEVNGPPTRDHWKVSLTIPFPSRIIEYPGSTAWLLD